MSPRMRQARVIAAWALLIASVVCWPVTALTVARHEPQFVLGLSFLAIIVEACTLLTSSQVHRDQTEEGPS